MQNGEEMKRSLKNRHIQMIALGGAIGTGLFYGSAEIIRLTGPGIILSFAIVGVAIFFIMRALGEMICHTPTTGSFAYFADKYWSGFAGYLSGWNYWFNYIAVSMAELSVVGIYIKFWYPQVMDWESILACWLVITVFNLISVKFFGEVEFWLSIVKVAVIIWFIVIGLSMICFGIGNHGALIPLDSLYIHGGFLPQGIGGLILSLGLVIFSFGGVELVGMAAGEAENPKKTIPRAINQVFWRILIFYVGAFTIMLIIIPWNKIGMEGSPFVQVFDKIGLPLGAQFLNFVVLTASLSAYNSSLYCNSRMLYTLSMQKHAPRMLQKIGKNGVPVNAVLTSSLLTFIIVLLYWLFPGSPIFLYVISIAIFAALVNWLMIMITHIKFKKKERDTDFPMPFFNRGVSYAVILFLFFIMGVMAFLPEMRLALVIGPLWIAFLVFTYKLQKGDDSRYEKSAGK